MKKILKHSLALASLALVAGAASAGIENTPHNLTTSGTGPNKQSTTGQICVFCHTPHASNTSVSAPLWNKGLPSTSYTTYSTQNSSTIDGSVLSVGSVSAACLSCHDGTQAMDNLVNAPGSGGYKLGGSDRSYNWTTGASKITGVANLGADLTNDHPIGIQYCGGGLTGSSSTVSGTCNDGDFQRTKVQTKNVNGKQVFWVDTTGSGVRSKNDIILYTRDFSGAAATPSVECASCHDPHVDKSVTGPDVNFMRVTTNGSAICLACHTK
ncbi:MAG TPA: cytochrome c3 family protein [Aromatoleum sp.]|uniref:cytochrome c3 family protein n=1 Tax=Aromatoleum sp. TaxID=2307007 RepID=UPI002B4A49F0|nr:cytochrome c3 family protein [Aromatoleum sp.]HJV25454.1 cytochrome c3 family protein [Aromatoleum sp.]